MAPSGATKYRMVPINLPPCHSATQVLPEEELASHHISLQIILLLFQKPHTVHADVTNMVRFKQNLLTCNFLISRFKSASNFSFWFKLGAVLNLSQISSKVSQPSCTFLWHLSISAVSKNTIAFSRRPHKLWRKSSRLTCVHAWPSPDKLYVPSG